MGLLSSAGVVVVTASLGRSPTPTGGPSEVGNFSEQVWGDLRERGQHLNALVLPALSDALPFVDMIEGVVIDQHLSGVPDDLKGEFVREFM